MSDVETNQAFLADVIEGLSAPQKAVPARWLYDTRGSDLFEAITQLPEYHATRTESAIVHAAAPELAALASDRVIVEFGSGSSAKTPLLIEAVRPRAYVPIDISGDFLRASADALSARFPDLPVHAVEADFTVPVKLPMALADQPRLGFFPGSTIGNMVARTAVDLLRSMRSTLGVDGLLLIGFDRIRDVALMVPAYDDAAGVTAAFNLNLLERINAELGGDIPVDLFAHRAVWNDGPARIEMHLQATRDLGFSIAGRRFSMAAGETIHSENSHKYGLRDAALLLRAGGWTPLRHWSDDASWFTVILAQATAYRMAP